MSFLEYRPPMGIYETLFAFHHETGSYMGDEGTHPFSQGFPRVDQIPGGPELPFSVSFDTPDLMYPKAWGHPALREAVANYYRTHYGAKITSDNVMIFAGGRPGLLACLLFLQRDIEVRIGETEYTPYYDLLRMLARNHSLVPSNPENGFNPTIPEYLGNEGSRRLIIASKPCNPTANNLLLEELVRACVGDNIGLLVDEAYELFQRDPISALAFVDDIDESNIFVAGAATKGLQCPGFRIGWVVTSRRNVEILGNFSSFGMGGVSHPAQLAVTKMFDPERIKLVRSAIPAYYDEQRERYGEAFERLGIRLFTGNGGFYHWGQLPGGLTAEEFNRRLFKEKAAILKGTDCDMARRGDASPLRDFFRFSFGPLRTEDFDENVAIIQRALAS